MKTAAWLQGVWIGLGSKGLALTVSTPLLTTHDLAETIITNNWFQVEQSDDFFAAFWLDVFLPKSHL
jgi:hypothetical protein